MAKENQKHEILQSMLQTAVFVKICIYFINRKASDEHHINM